MKTSTKRWLALGVTIALGACGPGGMMTEDTGTTPADSGGRETSRPDSMPGDDVMMGDDVMSPPDDVMSPDMDATMSGPEGGSGPEAGGNEGGSGPETGPVDAGPPVDPCMGSSVIDLATAGMRMGTTVRYTGSTTMAPIRSTVNPSCASGSASRVVALRYTPMNSTRIAISTDNMGTAMDFDTVVWAQAACAPSMTTLACDDDGGSTRETASVATTTMPVTAGTPIYIFVGGYGTSGESGAFELTISEIAQVAVGGTCDPTGRTNFCAMGSTCEGTGTMARCVAEGASGGRCRAMGTACDTGLACATNALSPRCRTSVAAGGMCDDNGVMNACATGSTCVAMGTSTTGTCIADGARGGRCRAMGTACEAGLACNGSPSSSFSSCVTQVAVGGTCDVDEIENVCAMGSTCEEVGTATRCVAAGADGGVCRTTGMACDTGLSCSGGFFARCRRTVAVGAACDSTGEMNACAAGSTCTASGSSGSTATCIADGAMNGRCRAMGAACEAGLACNGDPSLSSSRCRTSVAPGAACDTTGTMNTCAAGSLCVSAGTGMGATCIADGALNGRCRATGSACEAGLACNGSTSSTFSRCRTAVMVGAACDSAGTMNACAAGSACITVSGSMPTCIADGAMNGRCRATGTACESGFACNGSPLSTSSRCRTAVNEGAACDRAGTMNACASPLQCVAGEAGAMATCQSPRYNVAPLTGADATFIDACAMGMRLPLASTSTRDDTHAAAAFTLPFAFRFFDAMYMSVWPSVNGFAQLGTTAPSDSATALSSFPSSSGGAIVAPFGQDLVLRASPESDICVASIGTAPNRRVVLQWANAQAFGAVTTFLDFEAILNENGNVDYIYRRAEPATGADAVRVNGTQASIGLQAPMGARFVRYTSLIMNNSAVRFTPR